MSSALDKQIGGDHYKRMAIQPIEFCEKNRLTMAQSGVIKYVCRHEHKNGKQDLEKAIHLLELMIEMYYPHSHTIKGDDNANSSI